MRQIVREELERLRPAAEERPLGVREAAARLGLQPGTVYKRAGAGKLPYVKDGGKLLFLPADLDAYEAARCQRTPDLDPARIASMAHAARRR